MNARAVWAIYAFEMDRTRRTLMQSIAGKRPAKEAGRQYWKAAHIRRTLRRFYKERQHAEAENLPAFHDANLQRMFPQGPGLSAPLGAPGSVASVRSL